MINPARITVVLALVVTILGGYILFIDIPKSKQLEKQETEERQLLPFDDRAITEIIWKSPAQTIRLERKDQWRWEISEPIHSPADGREIRRVLRALTIGKIKRHIEDAQGNLSDFGLGPPHLLLTVKTPTEIQKMALGDAGPFAPSLYVQMRPEDQVVLTTLDVMSFAQKSLTNFRLKDLMLFDRDRVLELQIQRGPSKMVVTRVAGAHTLTPNWQLQSPVKGPADKTAVGTLLMDLSGLTATGFVDAPEEKKRIMNQSPKVHATIRVLEGSRTHHLELFQFDDPEKAYALTSGTDPLYKISPAILNPITQGLFYFQNKRLFGMEVNEIAMMMVETPEESFVLINQHDEWVLEEDPSIELDQEVVKLFVSRITDLPAEISHPDSSSLNTGMDSPIATFIGIDRNGEERGKLILGKRERGLVFAKGAGLPRLYQARSTILDQMPSKAQLINQQISAQ